MEIRIDRDDLFKAISRAQSIIEKRSNMPILSTILLSTVDSDIYLSATDLEISLQQKLPAEVINPGSVTISGRKLFEIVKESQEKKIHIVEKENSWIFISDDHARYNLACLPSDEYPVFMEPEDVTTIEIEGETLAEMINKTIYAVTLEEAGFKLSGVFTEKVAMKGEVFLRMVSTDGHRLSMIDKEIKDVENLKFDSGIMIPKKGMTELNKLSSEGGMIHLGFKKNNCVAKKDNTMIIIRLLESKFPDYNAVIPQKTKHNIKIKKDFLLNGMKKMTILSDESYKGVKITLEGNNMELVSSNPDLGDALENLEVTYEGEIIEMGFNAKYFIDTLQAIESDTVQLGFIDNSNPCLITGDDDKGFLGLIMPMRV
ncbi:MAG: DNA polymerase III subunit beta [Thermodesulfobacteriota bacterium]|nr:DNA polymerase III subunit beta [Thermodesulfobacteriota bacterium]